MPKSPRAGYEPAIDGLRALAVALVLIRHLGIDGFMTGAGAVGVAVFFGLSGFLITRLLINEHERSDRVDLRRFFRRRSARLLPVLLVFVGIALVWSLVDPGFITGRAAALSALMVGNLGAMSGGMGPLSHTWSLAVEWQFYLVWPFAFLALTRLGDHRRAALVVLAGVVAVVAWRVYLVAGDVPLDRVRLATDTRVDGLLLGAAAALWWSARPERGRLRIPTWTAAAALGGLGLLSLLGPAGDAMLIAGFTLAPLLGLVVIRANQERTWLSRGLAWKPLVRIGVISYSLYLWHYPLYDVLDDLFGLTGWIRAIVLIGVSLAAALASYELVEVPLRRRFAGRSPARDDDARAVTSEQQSLLER